MGRRLKRNEAKKDSPDRVKPLTSFAIRIETNTAQKSKGNRTLQNIIIFPPLINVFESTYRAEKAFHISSSI